MLIYYLLLFALCSSSEIFEEYYPQAEKFLQKMTMEERIGQMFFPRFIKADSSDDIKNRKPGGFVMKNTSKIISKKFKSYLWNQ